MMWARHRQHLYPEAGHTAGVRTFVFIRCLSVWRQDLMWATVKARMCLVMSKWDVQHSEKRAAATIKFTVKVGNLKFQVKEDKMLIFQLFGSCRHACYVCYVELVDPDLKTFCASPEMTWFWMQSVTCVGVSGAGTCARTPGSPQELWRQIICFCSTFIRKVMIIPAAVVWTNSSTWFVRGLSLVAAGTSLFLPARRHRFVNLISVRGLHPILVF